MSLEKDFTDGWKHFCNCIDFGKSNLDAEAIQFMNEMPGRILQCANDYDGLLKICKDVASMAGQDWLQGQLKLAEAIANAEKED